MAKDKAAFGAMSGKGRAARIPLDYHRQRDPVRPTPKGVLIFGGVFLIAVLLACLDFAGFIGQAPKVGVPAFLANGGLANGFVRNAANPGGIASVHATWESDCRVCHPGWQSVKSQAGDQRCETCHIGPVHHPNLKVGADGHSDLQHCAKCHLDHKGRGFSVRSVSDADCVACHRDLQGHVKAVEAVKNAMKISAFQTQGVDRHPEFSRFSGGPAADPGKLKFNHELHLRAGIVYPPKHPERLSAAEKAKMDAPTTWMRIGDPVERQRYMNERQRWLERSGGEGGIVSADSPVQLDCSSCHRLDGYAQERDRSPLDAFAAYGSAGNGFGNPKSAIPTAASAGASARTPGMTFTPVTYARNCKACHSLEVAVAPTPRPADGARPAATVEVPHGLTPQSVRDFLRSSALAALIRSKPGALDVPVQRLLAPGKAPPALEAERQAAEANGNNGADAAFWLGGRTVGDVLKDREEAALSMAYLGTQQTCSLCHHYADSKGQELQTSIQVYNALRGDVVGFNVMPTQVPQVWHPKANFNHSAHRAMKCDSCHEGAKESKSASDVLVPGITNCIKCHAPKTAAGGGVRSDCTTCHRYHNGRNPLEGRGSDAYRPADGALMDVQEFLQAAPKK